jgi:putative transposase
MQGIGIQDMFVDGVTFPMRIDGSKEKASSLVAIGVAESDQRKVLGLQAGEEESASSWREFFKNLKTRGLRTGSIVLGVMDELPGLERVKLARKLNKNVADDTRSIFYASSVDKALMFFQQFKTRWKKEISHNPPFFKRMPECNFLR